jgi:hypothetical protein
VRSMAHVVGTAIAFGFLGLAVANRVPQPASFLVELAALTLGGWYGLRNARKGQQQ